MTADDSASWRTAVESIIAPSDRDDELIAESEAQEALSDDRNYIFVAESDSTAIGLLTAYRRPDLQAGGRIVYLYDIEVADTARNKGIGRLLVDALVAACEQDDVHTIWAGTDFSNNPARRLFERCGATLEGTPYAEYEWELD